MNLTTKEDIIKEYPNLERMLLNTLIVSKEEQEENKASKRRKAIRYKVNCNLEVASAALLDKFLSDDRYYYYIEKMIKNEIYEFNISTFSDGDTPNKITFTKMEVLKGMEAIVENPNYFFDENHMERLERLKNSASLESFINDYGDLAYQLSIDNEEVAIPIINMINFLRLPHDYYDISINLDCLSKVKKEYFLYAVLDFFNKDNILDKYDLGDTIVKRIFGLRDCEKVDIGAFNKIICTDNPESKYIVMNPALHDEVLMDMPNNLTKLEKAIYIYIKMCKMLTYDEEFFVKGQFGEVLKKHSLLDSASKITPKKNEVVCYEFNAIYAKFLEELGINYCVNTKGIHKNLTFRYDKFIIDADSVTAIIRGDLFQSKFNLPLNGLECKNKNTDTKDEFNKTVDSVYKLINEGTSIKHVESFLDIVNEYKACTEVKSVSLGEKVEILINEIQQIKLANIDKLSYIKHLEKILFTYEESKNNIRSIFIRNNQTASPKAHVIFVMNATDVEKYTEENEYILYDLKNSIMRIDKSELQDKFMSGEFSCIRNDPYKIPGIKTERELVDERFEKIK